jgi:hypothetical protein
MRRVRIAALLASPFLLALLFAGLLELVGAGAPAPEGVPAVQASEPPPAAALPIRIGSPAPAAPRDPSPGPFEGRVLSAATGAPIPGADLTFSRGGAAASVRAGPDGAFLFQPLVAGQWLLATASAPGFFPFAPEWGYSPVQLEAAPGRRVRGLEVFLTPAVELAGVVEDEDGLPVPAAEVVLLGSAGRALITIPGRFVTDAAGEFQAAAPEGSVLEARKAGYYPGHAKVDIQVLVNGRIRITMGAALAGSEPARARLAGRVVGPDGRPVPGALVEAGRTHGWAYNGTPVGQALTDADGRFAFAELDRSPHRLTARAEGYQRATVGRVLPGGPEVKIALPRGGRLHGCVHQASGGAPVAPYSLRVYFGSNGFRSDPDLQVSVADPSGCFSVDELEAGQVTVVVVAPGHAPSEPTQVDVPSPPAAAQLEVSLGSGGTVAGVVRDEVTGEPLSGAWVSAEAVANPYDLVPPTTKLAETATGLDGAFTLGGLPREVRLIVNAARHHASSSGVVQVPAGDVGGPVTVALRPVLEGDIGPVQPVGIGAVLQPQGDELVVGGFRPGTPAEASGLVPGDQLLEIDGHPVSELGLGGAVEAIRGPEGTVVYLLVRRGNGTVDVEVPRRRQR